MKKIYILFFLSINYMAFAQYLPREQFNNSSLPTTWQLLSENQNSTWFLATETPFESNSAAIVPDPLLAIQNEWLVLPEVDFYSADSPILKFRIATSHSEIQNYNFSVKASFNDGATWNEVWNVANLGTFQDLDPQNVEVDLSYYLGEYVKVAFVYEANGGVPVYIDNVSVSEPGYDETIDDSYCAFTGIFDITPITFVNFADIQNTASSATSGNMHEFFLDQIANVSRGQSYPITLKGNTGGETETSYTAFIDWNQNGYFTEEDEVYFLGSTGLSTGEDDVQLTGTISVPPFAVEGETRMRIIKRSGDIVSFSACQSGSGNGQAEDYTINVQGLQFCTPSFTASQPITEVVIANISNQTSAELNAPSNEIFQDQVIILEQGAIASIRLKGNTNGNNSNSFTVFADWNQDGLFDEDFERYEIGIITNSTGIDEISLTGSIEVPINAKQGETLLRIIKRSDAVYASDACNTSTSAGQSEDYTLRIITGNCIKVTVSNGIENGHGNLANSLIANDFRVEAGLAFDAVKVKFDLLTQTDVDSADLIFYADQNGVPGGQIASLMALTPSSIENMQAGIGEFTLYRYSFNLPQAIIFEGGSTGNNYWVAVKAHSDLPVALSATTTLNSPYPGYISNDGEVWNSLPSNGNWDGVFTIASTCGVLSNNEPEVPSSVTFYPNPVNDVLNLKMTKTITTVEVINLMGQVLSSYEINNTSTHINTSGLATGIYMVQVKYEGGYESFKIIKN